MPDPSTNEALSAVDNALKQGNSSWESHTSPLTSWPRWYKDFLGEVAILIDADSIIAARATIDRETGAAAARLVTQSFIIAVSLAEHDPVRAADEDIPHKSFDRSVTAIPLRAVSTLLASHALVKADLGDESGSTLRTVDVTLTVGETQYEFESLRQATASTLVKAVREAQQ